MRLLDLFCGAGGAGMGYHRAGFEVVGVDHLPQPRYPFEFIQADALEYAVEHGREFDVIHASPPCQRDSLLAFAPNRNMDRYPDLIPGLRGILQAIGRPYIIENVPQATLINPLILCGTMFGLNTHRHRGFECNPPIWFLPATCNGRRVKARGNGHRLALYVNDPSKMATIAGHAFSLAVGQHAMGIDWMIKDEMAEAIPPAYTEWLGRQLLRALETGY